MYRNFIKRAVDIFISLIILIITSPIILLVAILLKFSYNTVFFIQERPGLNERIFKIYKFKTMNDRRDSSGNLLPDDQRITRLGKTVRSLSIDELPQLINVLKGEMSLIGPRPLLVKYLTVYNDFQRRRHEVRPGITGWSQVNGRNAVSWENRFKQDVWYVDNLSFLLDCRIVLLTIKKIILREGVSSGTDATKETFTGTDPKENDINR